jgi:hypothetical protein
MNGLNTKLPLMELGEKENGWDALWTNTNVTSGLKQNKLLIKTK